MLYFVGCRNVSKVGNTSWVVAAQHDKRLQLGPICIITVPQSAKEIWLSKTSKLLERKNNSLGSSLTFTGCHRLTTFLTCMECCLEADENVPIWPRKKHVRFVWTVNSITLTSSWTAYWTFSNPKNTGKNLKRSWWRKPKVSFQSSSVVSIC